MNRFGKARVTAGAALGVMALAVPFAAGVGPAAASGPGANGRTPVPGSIDVAALPGAVELGSSSPSTPEIVSFVLTERNLSQLESSVEQGVHQFLTVPEFAARYGQTTGNIATLEAYLAKYGITSAAYQDGVDVVTHGTVAEYNAALGVKQADYRVAAQRARDGLSAVPAQTVHGATGQASLPSSIASYVTAVLGLSNYSPYVSNAQRVNTSVATPKSDSSSSCIALTGLPDACNTPANFASRYGLDGLYDKHADGAGQTLAIVTLAAVDAGAPEYFWKNVAHIPSTTRTVSILNVDGGPGAPSANAGSGESDLDVEQSGGLAPGANVVVYQAPNTDYGFADAYFDAASQNVASSVSSSWAESETYLGVSIAEHEEAPAYQEAFDEAFLEFAVQGQSTFTAAGDTGAYAAERDQGSTNLSVNASGDSPFITDAGGTTLPWSATLENSSGTTAAIDVKAQRSWGWDYLWPAIAKLSGDSLLTAAEGNVGGGGGGFSAIEPTPAYQAGVLDGHRFRAVKYLTPTDYKTVTSGYPKLPEAWTITASPKVSTGTGSGRAVPDVSTDADPYTGYLLYSPTFGSGSKALEGGWGGTSFVAPQLNGSTAVIDSYLHHRVGFWNPAIYAFAVSKSSPFTVLNAAGTSNDNLYYTGGQGGRYNEASGLGYPNLTKLAEDFARW
jgi:kumamolisin